MLKLRKNINQFRRFYFILIALIWFSSLLIPWDCEIMGYYPYFIIVNLILPICCVFSLLLTLITKELKYIFLGFICIFAFWIQFNLIFGLLPAFLGN